MMTDWAAVFAHETPLLEIVVRGTAVYWLLFAILRFFLKRGEGSVGLSDMLMVVLLGGAIENAMAGDHETLTDGSILVLVLASWNYAMDWMAHRWNWASRFFEPPKVQLVKDGRMLRRAMRAELISEGDLRAQMRFNDITDLKDVKAAYLESNGEISVIKTETHAGENDSKAPHTDTTV